MFVMFVKRFAFFYFNHKHDKYLSSKSGPVILFEIETFECL